MSLGWAAVLCVPVLFSVFAVSSRIGQETKKGLIELIREQYGRKIAMVMALLIVAVNMAMIVGDIVAVSDSCSLLTMSPRLFFLAIVGFTVWYVLIIGDYQKTTKVLGGLTLILIAYVLAAYRVTDSFTGLAKDVLLPRMQVNSGYMMGVVAVFGSLLTPDVIVWQTSSKRGLPEGLAKAHVTESHAGTFVACLISLSAMVAASHMHVADPSNMTTRTASEALGSFGFMGTVLFALGIIASGMIALPILVASLCFSVARAAGWLSWSFHEATKRWFSVIINICLVFLAVVIDFFGVHTVPVLYWSQALAGVVLVPIFAYILLLSNNSKDHAHHQQPL